MDDHQHRRGTDRWHIMELAIPIGALFLLLIGSVFAWSIQGTVDEQRRLRHDHGQLMQKVVDACRRPLK
jgi:hypothetical protein